MNDNIIENIQLSNRAYNCLKGAGINTIEEMALTDLNTLRNCGKKTIKEINEVIKQLKEERKFSEEFLRSHYSELISDFIQSLDLSVRSKNVLKSLKVENENDLLSLTYEDIINTRNAGVLSANEIVDFIKQNRDKLENQDFTKIVVNYSIPVNSIPNFCGYTLIENLPMNEMLKIGLSNNNIKTILDLLLNKINLEEYIMPYYTAVYDYYYNIAYGPLTLTVSSDLSDLYVNLPFSMVNLKENYYIKIKDLIEYIIDYFGELELEDKLNSKLFLYWINSFDINDKKKYFIDKLKLSDKEFNILSLRGTRTLEEVGKIYGVTRERIRQIEKKAIVKVNRNYRLIPFKFIDNKKIYYVNELDEFNGLLLYIDTIIDEQSHIFIKKENSSYYFPTFYIDKMETFIHNNISQLEDRGYLEIDLNEWNDKDILNKTLEYLNFNLNGYKLTKKLTKRLQVKYAMKYLARPISISSIEDQNEIIDVVKYIFGTELDTGRAMEALIFDAGVRVDSGKYAATDNIEPLSRETLSKITKYVRERKIINTRDLFIAFGDELAEHNLNNETILYRYLKEALSNELYFHGVSAVISGDPELCGWGDVAIRIMKKTHKPINKLNFIVEYSLTDPAYNSLPINYDDIIVWSSKEIYLKSLLTVSSNIKEKIIDYIKENQIVRFDVIRALLNRLDINLIRDNNIRTNDNLFNFMINILPNNFEIDKHNEEIRYKEKLKTVIEETYSETEELTL